MDWITNVSWLDHLAGKEEPLRWHLNSTEDYLAFLCGPKRSHLFVPMSLIYALIFVVGVVGNLLVCLVIIKHRNMKTPTNYYLFSLAISDLLVLVFGMPLEVYEMWSNYPFLFGPVGCYFKTALFETVCFASILSVTTVSMERYVAILHPFRAKLESTRKRALRIIIVLWVLSVLFSLPNTSTHGILLQRFPNGTLVPGSATCTVVMPMWIYNCIIQVTSFLFYVLPVAIISVLYYLMGLKLRGDKSLEAEEMTVNIQRPSRKSVTKMLFVLVMVFAVCWAPFHIDRLFFSFVVDWTEPLANVFNLIHVLSGVFFYLSSAVNPIIYNLLSRRFRLAFLNVITPRCKLWATKQPASRIPAHQSLFLVGDCNLMDSAENASPPSTHRMSVCSSRLSTGL
ncbi:neuromedin-U receptor 2 [Alligator mississippiensis]|uniref:Neuromedin-U receptor 2 isoform A n=1 Tax=Alligator mississippiensis TaxID=8496 RepID=A0A151NM76_ALLMI|nr:neuromedin-U receptor 2 [Alligator mississippiensis]KYO37585.1 neuromedin-U receptor 2 isoform A [Alligator mississippiensis]